MCVGLIQQEQRLIFLREAEQSQNHQKLLLTLTQLAEGQSPVDASSFDSNTHFTNEL